MCICSNSNTVYPCKICNTKIKDTDSAAQWDICQFWIHMKCKNLNYIDYKYLQGSSDPWLCISCCNEIFLFGILTNKTSYLWHHNPTAIKISDVNQIRSSSSLAMKLSENLSLLFNQFNNFFPGHKNEHENLVNSNYFDIDQIQTLKYSGKYKSLSVKTLMILSTC